jgi:protein-S-isoprenylcysteine O-methyltransferase Ste14
MVIVVGVFSVCCMLIGLWLSARSALNAMDKQARRLRSSAASLTVGSWWVRLCGVARAQVIRLGHFLFGYRDYLFPGAFLLLALTTEPSLPFGSEHWDRWMDALGFVVAFIGQGCRILGVGGVENLRRRGRQKRFSAATLIRTGVFAHSRNPLYLGNLLIFCGLVIMANSYWWYVLALPGFVGVYWAIVLAEEAFLAERFGPEYEDYCRQVNRFVPRVPGLCRALASSPFDWKRVVRKETQVVCSWFTLAIGVLIWERVKQFGVAARRAEIELLVLILLAVYFAYGVVLWLKKKGVVLA